MAGSDQKCSRFPAALAEAISNMPDSAKTIGNTFKSANVNDIVLVGHPFAPIGMGEHVRSSFRAFRAAAKSVSIKDVYGLSSRDDASYEAEFAADLRPSLSRGVNIFHMNGDEIEQALAHMNDPAFEEAYNIVYPAWELSKYPDAWARQLERFDEVWAPSEFIGDAIRASVDRPVIHMPLAVEVNIDSFLFSLLLRLFILHGAQEPVRDDRCLPRAGEASSERATALRSEVQGRLQRPSGSGPAPEIAARIQ